MNLLVAPSGGSAYIKKHTRPWILVWAIASTVAGLSWCSTTSNMRNWDWSHIVSWVDNPAILPDGVWEWISDGVSENMDALLRWLLKTEISFNGKSEPMSPKIRLIPATTPWHYWIDHPNLAKITPIQLEIDSKGRLITQTIPISIDTFDFAIYAIAKMKYKISNGDLCTVEEWKNDKWIRVFYVKKILRKEEGIESVAQVEKDEE